jgi:molybdate transport system regulatory protein
MKVKVRLAIADRRGKSFMGIGLLWLLRGVERRGSIRRAAEKMGLSYPKALKILNHLERKLGRPLLTRTRGGKERGGASLTPFALSFLAEYERMHERVADFAEKEFRKLTTVPTTRREG